MRATLSSTEQVIILIAAIALCLMLLSIVFNMWPAEVKAASGSRDEVSKFLADRVQECFKRHNYGLDPKSAVCGEFTIESNGTVTEADMASKVDCSKTANTDCLRVFITKGKTFVSVKYLASERRVEVMEFGCFYDSDCEDGDDCTGDACLFPGTKESACRHEYSCGGETASCNADSDCAPEQCCHPTSCVHASEAPDCGGIACTMECQPGTMDCGAGTCRCMGGECAVEWAQTE
jgi:hypothetical protein